MNEEAIPLTWINEHIAWLEGLDNAFSTLTALDIRVMVKRWKEENFLCPYCGERSKWCGAYTWHGKMNWKLKSLLAKSHDWRIDHYKCHNCGAAWDTDPYPTDITGLR